MLNRLINKRIVKYNLVYRASENGFKLNRFYESYTKDVHDYRRKILDKVKPYWSLVLLKTEFGKVLGGVTAVDWDYLEEDYLAHSDDSGGSEQ